MNEEITECGSCGAEAFLMVSYGERALYRCRYCGEDTATTSVQSDIEFGMHMIPTLDEEDPFLLDDDALLESLGLTREDLGTTE